MVLSEATTVHPKEGGHRATRGLRVRTMKASDWPAVLALSAKAFPALAPWTPGELAAWLRHFPQGQLVAEAPGGEVVGMAIALLRRWRPRLAWASWAEATGGGSLCTHEPDGQVLYGVEVAVDPAWRGRGVGAALYEGRRQLARAWGLWGIVLGGRMPGYRRHHRRWRPLAYAEAVGSGRLQDPVLGFQLAQGFELWGVLPDYLPEDRPSMGHASLLVWRNPEAPAGAWPPLRRPGAWHRQAS